MSINGLVVMEPTSIVSTGTGNSSSINSDGSVTFASCATLSLNGVFTSSYDTYMIVQQVEHNSTATSSYEGQRIRMRSGGVDNSTASSYINQSFLVNSTTITASSATTNFGNTAGLAFNANKYNGITTYIFGPYLSQRTTGRSVGACSFSGGTINNFSFNHNQATSYDGVTLFTATSSMSGILTVFAFNQ